ncbi:MAG: hypothetical protein EOO00_12900, partial [Chitinophagaceae bacterium]
MRRIKTGVVGYGKSAKVFHIPFLSTMNEFEITKVMERHAEESKKKLPGVTVSKTFDELIGDDSTELIVITTPNDTHYDYASRALKAGKHVVLEKPFTNNTEEGEKLVQLAKETGKVLSVYQNRRYVSDFLTMRDLLNEKLLGDVHEFNATYDRYRPDGIPGSWREAALPGSGILFDLGPHIIDQVLVLFGNPKTITADIRKQRKDVNADDYFNIWLDYGFLKVILHGGMLVREQGPRYMIQGTKGSFLKYGEDPQAYNPYTVYVNTLTRQERQEANAIMYWDWTPVEGLTATVDFGLNYYNQFGYNANTPNQAFNFQTNTFG